jgi:hypothetical protein
VDFVVPDDEQVLVGHYSRPHEEMTAAQASSLIMRADDPLGYEVVLPRGVTPAEIAGTRGVPQVVGWRYWPEARGRRPCPCPVCQRGNIGASKVRARYGDPEDSRTAVRSRRRTVGWARVVNGLRARHLDSLPWIPCG